MELEAAEALADLAHLAMRESSGSEWGSKGKRARKRVRAESDSVSTYSDLPRVRFLIFFFLLSHSYQLHSRILQRIYFF